MQYCDALGVNPAYEPRPHEVRALSDLLAEQIEWALLHRGRRQQRRR